MVPIAGVAAGVGEGEDLDAAGAFAEDDGEGEDFDARAAEFALERAAELRAGRRPRSVGIKIAVVMVASSPMLETAPPATQQAGTPAPSTSATPTAPP